MIYEDFDGYYFCGKCFKNLDSKNEEMHDCPKEQKSDGGPAKYYDFNPDWVTLNDLMEDKAMNQWGSYSLHFKDIVKACFRFGVKDGTEHEYDTKKILYSALRLLVMMRGRNYVHQYLKQLLEDPQFASKEKESLQERPDSS